MRTTALLLLAACGGSGGDTPVTPVDPMALAAQVQQSELATTITALEAMGTRHTTTDGDERACDYLVGRFTRASARATSTSSPLTTIRRRTRR